MAEKRKPVYVFLLKKTSNGKTNKLEVFRSTDWGGPEMRSKKLYRLRVNGKWFKAPEGGRKYFYKTEIMRLLSNSIRF